MDYGKIISPTVSGIKPSGIRRFFDLAAEMDDVISLGVGEPDFSTPWHIRSVGIESLRRGRTWYTPNTGLAPLKEAISAYTERKYNISYDPKGEILVTVGGSEAIDLALRAVVSAGDEVIIPQPSFVCYEPLTRMALGVPVPVAAKEENAFRLTADELHSAMTEKTKLLILPYPNNPTGAVMRRQDLEEIASVLRGTDVMVLSDEIYSELNYTGEDHVSFASIDGMKDRTVYINGFSKAFAMTGWRLGYACGPAPVIKQMTKIHQFGIMSAPTTSQFAAIDALENGDEDVEEMRAEYDSRRKLVVSSLRRMGLCCFEPLGAFYVFPSIRTTGMTSEEFCEALLREEKVAVVPGSAFGESGEGYVRISYCYSVAHLSEALRRIKAFVERHTARG
ncbi:MAG: aminotransferase class I/II-fold pyridoxal phosphate-dependent enzyme [Clostridia bacterium]|nr:aminotransferase class I/II-fold pyridoxal phosphate-dependent enzyme [Clostridia bacterium]